MRVPSPIAASDETSAVGWMTTITDSFFSSILFDRVVNMVYPYNATRAVDIERNDINAPGHIIRRACRSEIGVGQIDKLALLCRPHRLLGAFQHPTPPRTHLHKHQRRAITHHQIDLTRRIAPCMSHKLIPKACEMSCSSPLAEVAKAFAKIGHARPFHR